MAVVASPSAKCMVLTCYYATSSVCRMSAALSSANLLALDKFVSHPISALLDEDHT